VASSNTSTVHANTIKKAGLKAGLPRLNQNMRLF
jgi:hypothetical protein